MFGGMPRRCAFAEDDLAEGDKYDRNPMRVNIRADLKAVDQSAPHGHIVSVDAYSDEQIQLTDNEHCQ